MSKKILYKLVAQSYSGNLLSEKKVNKIAAILSKSDLKKYINGLKISEKKKNVFISTPPNNQDLKKFKTLFPNKRIVFEKDPSLILGIKIVDNDIVYEFTLRNSLDKIASYIEQSYD